MNECTAGNSDIEIFIATHKEIEHFQPGFLPEIYRPVQVNCANTGNHWEGYYHDDEGENISVKNPSYCELTALYWGWKNSNADIKGLCHYRRFFSNDDQINLIPLVYGTLDTLKKDSINSKNICNLLRNNDCILTTKYCPYPFTAEQDLLKYCYQKDIDCMKDVIISKYPDYADALKTVFLSKNISYLNMFISKCEWYDKYCEWLFNVLQDIEQKIDVSEYDVQHKRVLGYLAEVLLNVYVLKNNTKIAYVKPIIIVSPSLKTSLKRIRNSFHRMMFGKCYFLILWIYRLFFNEKYNRMIKYK